MWVLSSNLLKLRVGLENLVCLYILKLFQKIVDNFCILLVKTECFCFLLVFNFKVVIVNFFNGTKKLNTH